MPTEDTRFISRLGWALLILFFGLFGTWSLTAPLNGAVVADGFVKVDGNRKSVQHLDGGIVKELRVGEGDHVTQGQVLIVLDDVQARAEFEILSKEHALLRLTEQRLAAELSGSPLKFPSSLADSSREPFVAALWQSQLKQFQTRKDALEGQRSIIVEKVNQLTAQIEGAEAQRAGLSAQLESVSKEKASLEPLLERQLIARPRFLQLERTMFGLQAQIGEMSANIARFKQEIAEQHRQNAQLDHDRAMQVTQEMRDNQSKLADVVPRLTNAKAVLERTVVRAPYSGRVVALNVFSVGAVIGRGDKILDIVPADQELVVEAAIGVENISDVSPDMSAQLRLTAYQQRTTPTIHGRVLMVSADRLTDSQIGKPPYTGAHDGKPFYVVQISVKQDDLAALPGVKLYPGMPVTAMIPTVERTAFRYLVGPLAASFDKAFRQR